MNLPNKLTISRIILVFVFMLFLFSKGVLAKSLALATFLAASLTDLLDGYIAKKYNMITDFGKLMDPIADKILVLSAFIAFVQMGLVPAWMVVIIIFREAAITGLRIFSAGKGKIIPADDGGKQKMVSQALSIFAILIFIIFRESGSDVYGFWHSTIFFLMLITTLLTLISGMSYLIRNRTVYFNAKTG